jgi:hypothetical protein
MVLIFLAVVVLIIFIIRCAIRAALDKTSIIGVYMRILMDHVHLLLFTTYFNFNWSYYIT